MPHNRKSNHICLIGILICMLVNTFLVMGKGGHNSKDQIPSFNLQWIIHTGSEKFTDTSI